MKESKRLLHLLRNLLFLKSKLFYDINRSSIVFQLINVDSDDETPIVDVCFLLMLMSLH